MVYTEIKIIVTFALFCVWPDSFGTKSEGLISTHQISYMLKSQFAAVSMSFNCPDDVLGNVPLEYSRFPHDVDCTLYHTCYKVGI